MKVFNLKRRWNGKAAEVTSEQKQACFRKGCRLATLDPVPCNGHVDVGTGGDRDRQGREKGQKNQRYHQDGTGYNFSAAPLSRFHGTPFRDEASHKAQDFAANWVLNSPCLHLRA
ncbi:MAG: hypothetical protein WBD75_02120 [Phycisphaerae bacterium]